MHRAIARTTNAHRTNRGRAAATGASPISRVTAPTTADLQLAAPHAMLIHAPPVMLIPALPVMLIAVAPRVMLIPALPVMLIPALPVMQIHAEATLQGNV